MEWNLIHQIMNIFFNNLMKMVLMYRNNYLIIEFHKDLNISKIIMNIKVKFKVVYLNLINKYSNLSFSVK
jgi:hypothetical protein